MSPAQAKPKQTELALTYSVGDWVWAKWHGRTSANHVARIESAQPVKFLGGEAWLVRCYYSPHKRVARARAGASGLTGRIPKTGTARGGWSAAIEHRQIERALNPAEVADLRNAGVIPVAGGIEALS